MSIRTNKSKETLIIIQLTKSKYKLNSYDYRIKQDGKEDIRTKKIIFELK